MNPTVHTLDLNFLGLPGIIASYLIPHTHGVVLVECGPASTVQMLKENLHALGYTEGDVTHVLLTHIHLDHAGAAGWLARQGAHIYVHPAGLPHLVNPDKLITSARRIYGDMMDTLWGEIISVPPERVSALQDGDVLDISGLVFRAIETPGHANHHHAYIYQDVCFSGDIGGIRLQNTSFSNIPTPPPEFHLEHWRSSLDRLRVEFEQENTRAIAPTHFGVFTDPDQHLARLEKALTELEEFIKTTLPTLPSEGQLLQEFDAWQHKRFTRGGDDPMVEQVYSTVNPIQLSVSGIQRYWSKYFAQ